MKILGTTGSRPMISQKRATCGGGPKHNKRITKTTRHCANICQCDRLPSLHVHLRVFSGQERRVSHCIAALNLYFWFPIISGRSRVIMPLPQWAQDSMLRYDMNTRVTGHVFISQTRWENWQADTRGTSTITWLGIWKHILNSDEIFSQPMPEYIRYIQMCWCSAKWF